MFYISEKEYKQKLRKIELKNKCYDRRQNLKNAKRKSENKLSTTKMITLYLFVVLNVILVYSLIAMWHFENLTYLGTLIADVAGQILVFFIYVIKSTKENTQGGITYEIAMANLKEKEINNPITDNLDDETAVG